MTYETRVLTEAEYGELWPELKDIKCIHGGPEFLAHQARHEGNGSDHFGNVTIVSMCSQNEDDDGCRLIIFDRVGFIGA